MPGLEILRALEAVSRAGSISGAARMIGVTQQALSARIRSGERALGFPLLVRSPSGSRLTPAGMTIADCAEELLRASHRLEAAIAALREQTGASLSVAASQTVAGHLLPGWLVAWRLSRTEAGEAAPEVRLQTANSTEVCRLVRAGEVDLGFVESPAVPGDLGSATLGTDALTLVVSPSHPWTGRSSIPLAEVAATALVAREPGSGTRETWEEAAANAIGHPPVAPAVELGTTAAVRSAIAAGLAPGVLSARAVGDDIALGRLVRVEIDGPAIARPIRAVWRGGPRDLGPAARELLAAAARRERSGSRGGGAPAA